MTATALAARARGLSTRLIADDAMAAIDRAGDPIALATALVHAGVVPAPVTAAAAAPGVIDGAVRARAGTDLAVLARWARDHAAALDVIALDEDRRSLRAIARGLAAGASAERRLEGTVPTARLPVALLTALAGLATADELATVLARRGHPFAVTVAAAAHPHRAGRSAARHATAAHPPLDLLELELALARRFVELARASLHGAGAGDALRVHLAQVIDAENAVAALLVSARGADLDPDRAFLLGGHLVDRATFTAAAATAAATAATAAAGPLDDGRARLAAAFARTPLARAVTSRDPAAVEDAALAWHLATQARLRRTEPHGLAPVLHLVLRRRAESRHLRRAAWRVAMGGAP